MTTAAAIDTSKTVFAESFLSNLGRITQMNRRGPLSIRKYEVACVGSEKNFLTRIKPAALMDEIYAYVGLKGLFSTRLINRRFHQIFWATRWKTIFHRWGYPVPKESDEALHWNYAVMLLRQCYEIERAIPTKAFTFFGARVLQSSSSFHQMIALHLFVFQASDEIRLGAGTSIIDLPHSFLRTTAYCLLNRTSPFSTKDDPWALGRSVCLMPAYPQA